MPDSELATSVRDNIINEPRYERMSLTVIMLNLLTDLGKASITQGIDTYR